MVVVPPVYCVENKPKKTSIRHCHHYLRLGLFLSGYPAVDTASAVPRNCHGSMLYQSWTSRIACSPLSR